MPPDRFAHHVKQLVDSVFRGRGTSSPGVRGAIHEQARRVVGGGPTAAPAEPSVIPPALEPYLDTVIRQAYKVSDADVEQLKGSGHSEDDVFEVTVAAAVGAGVSRLDRALGLLKGER